MASTAQLNDARCQCHRLLFRVSSTSNARIEAKCPRCAAVVTLNVNGSITTKAA